NGRDGGLTAEQLTRFRSVGRLDVEADQRARWIDGSFRAAAFDDEATLAEIARVHRDAAMVVEPHTATSTAAARLLAGPAGPERPFVSLATAHPAKFPDAVQSALGVRPDLPAHLADLFERPERTETVANDLAAVEALVERLTGH
ncbi:MAG: threonine synthase, partial [Actinomycetota bacterium]